MLDAGMQAIARGDLAGADAQVRALEQGGLPDQAAFLRATCAESRGDLALRLAELRRARELAPGEAAYAIELAKACADAGLANEAVALLAPIIEQSDHAAAADAHLHFCLALWREADGQVEGVEAALERSLTLRPDHAGAAIKLAERLPEQGPGADKARATLRNAAAASGEDGLLLRSALRLPAAYESVDHMNDVRAGYVRDLEEMLARPTLSITHPEQTVGRTAFMLAYHGESNREVHELLARVVRRGYHAAREPLIKTSRTLANRRRRVGFASGFFWLHSVGRALLPLVEGLDRTLFDVHLFAVPGQRQDDMTRRLSAAGEHFVELPADLAGAAHAIAVCDLDILIYPEVGIHPFINYLAYWRLAPLQCAFAGHPDTTGIDTIDCFLSDGRAEPPGAEAHYAERLVRIDDFYLPIADLPLARAQSHTHLPHRYVCSQTIMKLHPEFDSSLDGILKADRKAEVLLFGDCNDVALGVVLGRMTARLGTDMARVRILARQTYEAYLDTICSAAVMLDTPHFGGGNTTLEALAANIPVVCQRGAFLRSRFAATRLTSLGLEECIATDSPDYVQKAVALAASPERQRRVRSQLRERCAAVLAPSVAAASFNSTLRNLHVTPQAPRT